MERTFFKAGIAWMFCLVLALAVSCSSDGDESDTTATGRKLRQLTLSEVPVSRAALTDDNGALAAAWRGGDVATLVNVSAIPSELLFGSFTATSDAVTSAFSGSLRCDADDVLAMIYPKVVPATGNGAFTITLAGQKGTLADVAERYHYIYGVGKVTSVTENTANAVIASMQPLLAVARFTFKDNVTGAAIPVKTLTVNYGDEGVGYPQTATIVPQADAESLVYDMQAQGAWQPLIVTLDTETADGVCVALFPLANKDVFHFTVTGSEGTYTGTASAILKAGKYYPVNLKLNK